MSGRIASQYGFETNTLATGNAFDENIFSGNISFADNSLLAAASTTRIKSYCLLPCYKDCIH